MDHTEEWFSKNWYKNNYSGKNIPSSVDDNYFVSTMKQLHDSLEKGTTPFFDEKTPLPIHHNATTGEVYDGINAMLLSMNCKKNGYEDPRWISEETIANLKLSDKISGNSTLICHYNKYCDTNTTSKYKYDRVYNVSQLSIKNQERYFKQLKEHIAENIKPLVLEDRANFTVNNKQSKFSLPQACHNLNADMPKLTTAISQHILCQRLQIPYKPLYKKEDLQNELKNILNTKKEEIPQQFAKSCYYANKAVNHMVNKDQVYSASIHQVKTNTQNITNQRVLKQHKNISLAR